MWALGTERSVTTWVHVQLRRIRAGLLDDRSRTSATTPLVRPLSDPMTGIATAFFSLWMCSAYWSGCSGHSRDLGTPQTRPQSHDRMD